MKSKKNGSYCETQINLIYTEVHNFSWNVCRRVVTKDEQY